MLYWIRLPSMRISHEANDLLLINDQFISYEIYPKAIISFHNNVYLINVLFDIRTVYMPAEI